MTLCFGYIGYLDDSLKVKKKNAKGLPGKARLLAEFAVAGSVVAVLIARFEFRPLLHIPILKAAVFDLGWWYAPFAALVVVGCANAVNLTDGLDGLAIVPVIICAATFTIFSYIAGNHAIAAYLQIPFIRGAGELTPLAGAMVAAGLGFLWFNAYPAQVFMGDVGSLSIGGFLRDHGRADQKRARAHGFGRRVRGRGAFGHHPGRFI